MEVDLAEINCVVDECVTLIEELPHLMQPEIVKNDLANVGCTTCIRREPKGTVLVIGAWNYPVNLVLMPFAGAIAAGCTAVVKPSEVSPYTAKLLGELFPRYLDADSYQVVNGAVDETSMLLNEFKWDHILYTGSGMVGKIIMSAAAKHLTPVTLELGGKCPAIVSDDSDLDTVTKRLLWGKLLNAGQTCICIDYVLCSENFKNKLIPKMKAQIKEWYGDDVQKAEGFGRIVNGRHFSRIMKYIQSTKGEIVMGGQSDAEDLFIAPTVVVNPAVNEPLMSEEIFGPVLPILTVKNLQEAVDFVNARDHPLALYVFTKNTKEQNFVLDNTQSGGVCVNDSVLHLACHNTPFGGIGPSGLGAYHGKFSFETFSHQRTTLVKSQGMEFLNNMLRYPPFTESKLNMMSKAMFKTSPSAMRHVPWKWIILGVVLSFIWKQSMM